MGRSSKTKPVTPSRTYSGIPATFEQIAGVPQAIASRSVNPISSGQRWVWP
jgi:hypothetical protein